VRSKAWSADWRWKSTFPSQRASDIACPGNGVARNEELLDRQMTGERCRSSSYEHDPQPLVAPDPPFGVWAGTRGGGWLARKLT
jgi:hypothetical protein